MASLRFALAILGIAALRAEQVTVGATGDSHGARFTDVLAVESGELWRSVVTHKFTDQLAAGTLDLGVLKCYLIQDHRFLDAFVVLLSSMIAAARSLPDRIPGAQFLALITGKENTYFERAQAAFERATASESARTRSERYIRCPQAPSPRSASPRRSARPCPTRLQPRASSA